VLDFIGLQALVPTLYLKNILPLLPPGCRLKSIVSMLPLFSWFDRHLDRNSSMFLKLCIEEESFKEKGKAKFFVTEP
jgi:hypothetical protein